MELCGWKAAVWLLATWLVQGLVAAEDLPGPIKVINVSTSTISLTWEVPPNMTDANYSITYQSHTSNSQNFNITNNSTTIKDLIPGTEYTISVTTIRAASTLSNNVSVTQYTQPVQIPVSNVTVDNQGTTNSLKVTWHSPPGNVENYNIQIKDDLEDPAYIVNFTVPQTTTSHTISGLRPGRNYNITVATISGPHNIVSDRVLGVTIPTNPGPINVTNVSTSTISLTWGAPPNMTDGTYGFSVTYWSLNSNAQNLSITNNSTTIKDLIPGTAYTIFVATIGAASILSNNVSVTQYTEPVQIPVSNVTVDNQGTTNSLKVTWHSPPGNVENYTIQIKDDLEDPAYIVNVIVPHTNTSHMFNGLRPGRSYNITVATNSGPHSIVSIPVSDVTIPTKPGPIKVTNVNTSTISLIWGAPPNMTDGTYNFSVTYWSHDSNAQNLYTTKNSTTIKNLISGTKYTISVATIGAASTLSNNVSVTKYTQPVQIPVSNVTVDNQGTTNSLKVTWHSPPGNVEKYTIQIKDDLEDPAYIVNFIVPQTATSHTISGLRPGRNYNITVATISGPHNIVSDRVLGVTIPTKPGPIKVTNVNTSTISLIWGAPPNMTDGTYSFSVTYWSHDSNAQNLHITNNSTTIKNLISGTKYTISVATIGAASILSNSVSVIQYTQPVQIPVSNVTVDNQGTTNSLKVTWHSPPGNVEKYTIQIKDDLEDPAYIVNFIVPQTVTSHTISGLRPGRNYNITVATISGPHNIVSDRVLGVTIPTKPGPIKVTNVNTTTISLIWGAPPNMTDGTYSFSVTYWSHDSNAQNLHITNNSTTIKNLISGTKYTISVATIGAASTLSNSVSLTQYTQPVQIPVSNVTVDNQGTTNSLKVTWHSPPGNVEKYTIQIRDDLEDPAYIVNVIVPHTNTSHMFNGLRPGRSYNITVATDSGPHSIVSIPVSDVTIPTKPGSIKVTNVNTSTISLIWGAPPNMTDGTYSFNVTYWSHDSNAQNLYIRNNSTTIKDLIPGTRYTISVATIGAASILSNSVSVTQYTEPVQIPASNVTVDNQGTTNSLKVTWHSPPGNVENYTIEIKDDLEDPAYIVNVIVPHTNTSHMFNGLRPGRSYNITVATNSGPHSIVSIPVSDVTIPTKPGPIKVTNVNTSTISLIWGAPPNMTDGTYSFSVTYWSHDSNAQNLHITNNSTTIKDLISGTKYTISVATIGAASILSNSVSVTQYTEPVKISVSNMMVDNQGTTNSLKVTWHSPPGNVENYTIQIKDVRENPAYIVNVTVPNTTTSHTFNSLRPGRRYTITVATVSGSHSIVSDPASGVTKPNSVRNVTAMADNSTSVSLQWKEPVDADSGYTYRVLTQGYNQRVTGLTVTVPHLTPGNNITFSIFSQIESTTEGRPVMVATCTDAASVDNFTCEPVDEQKKLKLSWNCPVGVHSSFFVIASPLNPTTVPSVNNNYSICLVSSAPQYLTDLQYGIQYTLTIVSKSCGRESQPVSKVCRTSVTDPPHPTNPLPATGLTVTHNSLKFTFLEDSFDSINGQIVAFAVVVGTERDSGSEPVASSVGNAYSDGAAAYTTYLINRTQTARAANNTLEVTVGNGDTVLAYDNGKLDPVSKYRLSLIGFTSMKLTKTNRIDAANSLFTSFPYSRPIQTTQDPSVIVGAVVGTLLGVAVVSLLVFALFRWRRRQKQEIKNADLVPINDIRQPRKAIRVDQFENYYNKQHADSDCGFAEEFEDLKPLGTKQSTHAAQEPINKAKNRYNNVLPYDVSRVKLSASGDPASDYINANFVPGYHRQREFIAAQGPLAGTVADFWQMVWEMRVAAIVMLTKCVEQGRAKCEQYWPTDHPLSVGNITVSRTSEILLTDWTIRDFKLERAMSRERRTVRHFHFMAWPDHNVPNTTQLLLEFRDLVRQHLDQHTEGPAVVHCSAGVGRTGTFICVDRLVYQIDNHDKVDIFETVCDLRMHRTLMVQTESQYVFLNRCAKDYIESRRSQGTNSIYENTPDLIYQNYSANGCAT